MAIQSRNILEESQALYKRMIEDLIVDIPLDDGRYQPRLDFPGLTDLVRFNSKPAQVAIQMLVQTSEEDRQQAELHATWLMMAYIVAFGREDSSIDSIRMMAPEIYEAAVLQLKDAR